MKRPKRSDFGGNSIGHLKYLDAEDIFINNLEKQIKESIRREKLFDKHQQDF